MTAHASEIPAVVAVSGLDTILMALGRGISDSRDLLVSVEQAILASATTQPADTQSFLPGPTGRSGGSSAAGLQEIDRVMQRLADLHRQLSLLASAASEITSPLPATELAAAANLAEIRAIFSPKQESEAPLHPDPILF